LEHYNGVLIGAIVISDRAGDRAEHTETESFPQMWSDVILGEDEIEDHAAIPEFLGIVQGEYYSDPSRITEKERQPIWGLTFARREETE